MHSTLRSIFRSHFATASLKYQALPVACRPSAFKLRLVHTKKYTSEHEIVNFDDETGVGTIAITNHAQEVLGDVVFVELPPVGTQVKQGESIGAVESVKAASEIYAPVSGTVEEVNDVLADQPGLLNKSAEEDGWLCKIKLSDPSEVDKLMTFEEYNATIES